ncbi:histidine decarboxylase [Aureibacter tunicatorum]|uniref:Histidine decarboxylase n=1 Tax=Aureibacter tunicatorum TaxID=866807 RepID=A0AAE3XQ58_9BACT|nr:histidine decarboxylase [Aureibacter tunicatorum]MDR6240053.1 histidine decarboxylase [Aureibacter tunicatorum]BDD04525.1 histidine decarboxylase [Aureibacter tunicatorum]
MEEFDYQEKLTQAEIRLTEFLAEQIRNSATYFGYPEIPQNNDLSILGISGLAKLHLNNAGDPSVHGNAKMHTKEFEKEVLDFVAKLYDLESYWGYITSGGTEGNLYGLYMGREYFTQKNKKPFFLFSSSSHYSIPKNAHLLNVDAFQVNCDGSGEMNYKNLTEKIKSINTKHKEYGLIINLNIGTTMTGAMDELSEIHNVLDELHIPKEDVYIHADAALMGFIYPFLSSKEDLFANGVSSIAISGHKFPGTIHPCGVLLANKSMHDATFQDANWIPYLEANDTTISGSRNGFLALNFWYIIQKKGVNGFKEEAMTCIENAQYLYNSLNEMNYPDVAYNADQLIVTFEKPCDEIVQKYQLATQGNKAHIVVMQHISKHKIDQFCTLLKSTSQNLELVKG